MYIIMLSQVECTVKKHALVWCTLHVIKIFDMRDQYSMYVYMFTSGWGNLIIYESRHFKYL